MQVHDTKHFDVTTVVISVNDINDCTPQFYHSHYSLNFDESEGGPRPFCLGKVEAYDLDIVNRDSVFYEIKSGNEQNLFHVEKNKGNCFKLLRFESEFLRRKFNGAFVEQKYDILGR